MKKTHVQSEANDLDRQFYNVVSGIEALSKNNDLSNIKREILREIHADLVKQRTRFRDFLHPEDRCNTI